MIIGLTGGIASGKSTLSAFFSQNGCFVIDADKIAHEVTSKNSEGAKKQEEISFKMLVFENLIAFDKSL